MYLPTSPLYLPYLCSSRRPAAAPSPNPSPNPNPNPNPIPSPNPDPEQVRPLGSRSLVHEAEDAPLAAGGGPATAGAGAGAGAGAAGGGGAGVGWPLYGKGVESSRLSKALRLLTQDVHQLLDALGAPRVWPGSAGGGGSVEAGAGLQQPLRLLQQLLPALRLLLRAMHQAANPNPNPNPDSDPNPNPNPSPNPNP